LRAGRWALEAVRRRRQELGDEQGRDARLVEKRIDEQPGRDERECHVGEEEQPPPVERVRDCTRVERHRQQGQERGE